MTIDTLKQNFELNLFANVSGGSIHLDTNDEYLL